MTTEPQCDYKPSQGIYKGTLCVLPIDHDGPHIYDPAKVPLPGSVFTAAEVADAIAEDEIRARSEKLDDAQGLWERAYERARPKVPCPECSANGSVVGGSLGDHCPTCNGTRVVTDDAVEFEFQMPAFPVIRAALSAYANTLVKIKHGLPSGLVNSAAAGDRAAARKLKEYQEGLVLPPAATVPTMEQIEELLASGKRKHKELAAGGAPLQAALPAPGKKPRRSGFETEGGIEETASDAELDAIDAELGNS